MSTHLPKHGKLIRTNCIIALFSTTYALSLQPYKVKMALQGPWRSTSLSHISASLSKSSYTMQRNDFSTQNFATLSSDQCVRELLFYLFPHDRIFFCL